MIKQYRKKPVVIEAILWDGTNWDEIAKWSGTAPEYMTDSPTHLKNMEVFIRTLEGEMRAEVGDYIIKGVIGEFYPCRADVFERTYEVVTTAASPDHEPSTASKNAKGGLND